MPIETSTNTITSSMNKDDGEISDHKSIPMTPSSVQNTYNHSYNIGTSFENYGPGLNPSPKKNDKVVKQLLLNSTSSPTPPLLSQQLPQVEGYEEITRIEVLEIPITEHDNTMSKPSSRCRIQGTDFITNNKNNNISENIDANADAPGNKQQSFDDQDLLELKELLEAHEQLIHENKHKDTKIVELKGRLIQETQNINKLKDLLEEKSQTVLQLETKLRDQIEKCRYYKEETQQVKQSIKALESQASSQFLGLQKGIRKLHKELDFKFKKIVRDQLISYESNGRELTETFRSLAEEQKRLYDSEIARVILENDTLTNSSKQFTNLYSSLTLYGRDLGEPIRELLEANKVSNLSEFELEKSFQRRYPDISGFLTSDLKMTLTSNKTNNTEKQVRSTIQSLLKTHFENSKQEQQRLFKGLQNELEQLRLTNSTTLADNLKKDKVKRDEFLRHGRELNDKILLEFKEGMKFMDEERQKFSQRVLKFDETSNFVSENQGFLEDSISKCVIEIERLLKSLESRERRILELERELWTTQGNQAERLTFEKLAAINSAVTKETYNYLGCDSIDLLTNVELGNTVKQLVVLLEVPYTKLRRKIPLIAIYLKYERNLYGYFANRLYYSRFNVPIDSQLLTHEAYMQYQRTGDIDGIVHPLGECLDNLYGDILSAPNFGPRT